MSGASDQKLGSTHAWGDGLAVGTAALCLLHCLGLPLLIAALPSLASTLSMPDWTHTLLLLLAVPLSAKLLLTGYRQHGRSRPPAIGSAGLASMASGVAFEDGRLLEIGLTVTGTVLVAAAHLRNWQLLARRRGRSPIKSASMSGSTADSGMTASSAR